MAIFIKNSVLLDVQHMYKDPHNSGLDLWESNYHSKFFMLLMTHKLLSLLHSFRY